MPPPDRVLSAVRERLRPRVAAEAGVSETRELAGEIAAGGGAAVEAVVFFGSRRTRATPDASSAYDFFVLTRGYRGFYRSLSRSRLVSRRPWLLAALNAVMPPNQIALKLGAAGERRLAKCAVVSVGAFERETSLRRRDHFHLGRLFQPVDLVYARDAAAGQRVLEGLARAARLTFHWARPWLPERFDAEAYGAAVLRVSLSHEVRPEPTGRALALWEAQREEQLPVWQALLEALAAEGALVDHGDAFSSNEPASALERLRLALYFRWSLVRATLRWAKYVVTFEGWLEYIVSKARRHTGEPIALTRAERRFPLLLLWGRLVRFLRDKDRVRRQG